MTFLRNINDGEEIAVIGIDYNEKRQMRHIALKSVKPCRPWKAILNVIFTLLTTETKSILCMPLDTYCTKSLPNIIPANQLISLSTA